MRILSFVVLLGLLAASGSNAISITEAARPYTITFGEWVVVWVTVHYLQSLPSGASVWFKTEHSDDRPGEWIFHLWIFIWDPKSEQAYKGPNGIVNQLKEYIRSDFERWRRQGYDVDFDKDVVFYVTGPS